MRHGMTGGARVTLGSHVSMVRYSAVEGGHLHSLWLSRLGLGPHSSAAHRHEAPTGVAHGAFSTWPLRQVIFDKDALDPWGALRAFQGCHRDFKRNQWC